MAHRFAMFLPTLLFFLSLYMFWPLQTQFVLHRVCEAHGYHNTTACRDDSHVSSVASQLTTHLTLAVSLPPIFTTPTVGVLLDSVGRKPVLVGCLLGNLLPALAFFLVSKYRLALGFLFLGQALQGLLGGSTAVISCLFAYTADASVASAGTAPASHARTSVFGGLAAMIYLGACVGPTIQGHLRENGVSFPTLFSLILAANAANVVYACCVPESLPPSTRKPLRLTVRAVVASPVVTLRVLLKPTWLGRRGLLVVVMAFAVLYGTYVGEVPIFILYVKHVFGWGPERLGNYLSFSNLARALGSAVGLPLLMKTMRPTWAESDYVHAHRRLELACVAMGAVGFGAVFFAQGLAPSTSLVYLSLAFYPVASVAIPCTRSIVSQCFPTDQQGEVFAAVGVLESVFSTVGIYTIGSTYAYTVSHWAPAALVLVGALNTAAGAVVWLLHRNTKAPHSLLEPIRG